MGYVRTLQTLTFTGTGGPITIPARIRSLGVGRADMVVYNTSVTHTASTPRHGELAEDIIVDDGVYEYRVIEVKEILGKYRLSMERL